MRICQGNENVVDRRTEDAHPLGTQTDRAEKLKIEPESNSKYIMTILSTDSESTATSQLLQDVQTDFCTLTLRLQATATNLRVFSNNFTDETIIFEHTFSNDEEGLYDFEFERCSPRRLVLRYLRSR